MNTYDKFGYSTRYGLERLDKDDKGFVPYVHYDDMLKAVNGMSTVEIIPKDDYEARLRTDMTAMLEELDFRLSNYQDTDLIRQDIQEKINSLKEDEDEKK